MSKWLILLIVFVILVFVECVREVCVFRTIHYSVQSPKLEGIKRRNIVLLSDLHNYTYGKGNEKLLKAIKKEKPDMILIAGDMLIGNKNVSTEIAREFVTKLPKVCDTYYANGNHEQRMKENEEVYGTVYQEYKKQLQEAGIVFLENECVKLQWEDCDVEIHGLEIPNTAYKKFKKISLPDDCMETCLGKADSSKYQILIAHNPIFMRDYLKWGADLVVSGHLHGGVVRIPGLGGVITPQFRLFPKYSGEHTVEDGKSVVVSKGLGAHTLKIRFLNPAEVVVLHIGKE